MPTLHKPCDDAHTVRFTVVAGEGRDEGGVRFSCPVGDADCSVSVKFGCLDFVVVSAGGRVSAHNHVVELPDDAWLNSYCAANGLSILAGAYRDSGEVHFTCPPEGADCEVTFGGSFCINTACPDSGALCVDRIPGAYSLGGAASAKLASPGAPPACP